MISKFGVGTLLAVAMLFIATPSNVFAATSSADKAKIKKYSKQLNALPNAAAPASKVNTLVTRLVQLDPKKAKKYYNTGLTKLSNVGNTAKGNATKIAASVTKVLKKSGLSSSEINKLTKQVQNESKNYVPASPTAMLSHDLSLVLA